MFATDAAGEMGRRIAALDWSQTPLGPLEAWPQSLTTTVSTLLHNRFPMFLFWGPDAICLYNDAYRPSLGADMHPQALGMRGEQLWSDIWHIIGPQIDAVMARGEQTWFEDQLVPFDRNGYFEEIYFTYSYSPVFAESGTVGGTLVVCSETTQEVVSRRRLQTLLKLSLTPAVELGATLEAICEVLADASADLAFTALYRPLPDAGQAELVWSTGLPRGHSLAPARIDLGPGATPWPDPAGSRDQARPAELADPSGTVPSGGRVVVDVDPSAQVPGGSWPEPCRQAVVTRIPIPGAPSNGYLLVTGLSPRKALDAAYHDYLDLLVAGMAASIGQAVARDGERRRLDALAAIDRAKTDFFANVSHEFRTPLTLLLGPLEDLITRFAGAEPPHRDDVSAQLAKAHGNAARLLRLVNTLLEIIRLDAGEMVTDEVPTELGEFTAELAEVFGHLAQDAGLQLVVDCPPMPGLAVIDREMWERVVLNLVSNAVKYTLAGSVTVRLRYAGAAAELVVEDTGVGIAEPDQQRIFERFYRVPGAGGHSHEGSGIGLSLVTELVQLNGGTVTVDSQVGRGSTFRVRLPVALLDRDDAHRPAPPDPSAQSRIFAAEAARWLTVPSPEVFAPGIRTGTGAALSTEDGLDAGTLRMDGSRARVLVVDDNPDMRAHLSRLLGRHWEVSTAADGVQALALMRRVPVDLVLTDVMMPELDGLGLLHAIRRDPELRQLPVIVLSARAGQEAAVEGLDAGADDYVAKPFSATELISRVRTNLAAASHRAHRVRAADERAREAEALAALTQALNRTSTLAEVAGAAELAAGYLGATSVRLHLNGFGRHPGSGPDGVALDGVALDGVALDGAGSPGLEIAWPEPVIGPDALRRNEIVAVIVRQATERAAAFEREQRRREVADRLRAAEERVAACTSQAELVELMVSQACFVTGAVAAGGLGVAKGRLADPPDGGSLPVPLSHWLARTPSGPLQDAARSGQVVTVLDQAELARRYPELASDPGLAPDPTRSPSQQGFCAVAVIPYLQAGQCAGVVGLAFAPGHVPEPEVLEALPALSTQWSLATDRIWLAGRDHAVAVQLQKALLGHIDELDGVHASTAYRPATAGLEIGGDWHDAIRLPDGRIGLVIGDVVGHGLVAATVMGQLRSAVRALAPSVDDPAALVERLEVFSEHLPDARYTTLTYAILDPQTGQLDYTCAGHPPPFVLHLDGRSEFLTQGRGSPVGTQTEEGRVTASTVLPPGSTLMLYTDGLIERRGEPLTTGMDRLAATAQQFWLRTEMHDFAEGLVTAMLRDADQSDDVAVLSVCMDATVFQYRLPADARTLRDVRTHLRAWLEGHGNATAEDVDRTLVAVSEVCSNAVEHAYHGDGVGIVEIRIVAGSSAIAIQVCDQGRWRPRLAPGHRGRGLRMVRAVAERVDILPGDGGTTVRLAIALGAKPAIP